MLEVSYRSGRNLDSVMIISQIGGNKMKNFMGTADIAAVLVTLLALVVVVTGAFAQGPSAAEPTD